jgi:PAS domain-containing protein
MPGLTLPFVKTSIFNLLVLAGSTIGLGSWATVKIPPRSPFKTTRIAVFRFSHLSHPPPFRDRRADRDRSRRHSKRSSTSWAILLEETCRLFSSKTIARMAFSTSVVIFALVLGGLYMSGEVLPDTTNYQSFYRRSLCYRRHAVSSSTRLLQAFTISFANGLLLVGDVEEQIIWTIFTYFAGAVGAGALFKLGHLRRLRSNRRDVPDDPVSSSLAYRMYLKNVEMSIAQAEQAEKYAKILEERSNALRESEERFRSAFAYAPIGIGLVSRHGKWLKVNHALCEILGYDADELLSMEFQR